MSKNRHTPLTDLVDRWLLSRSQKRLLAEFALIFMSLAVVGQLLNSIWLTAFATTGMAIFGGLAILMYGWGRVIAWWYEVDVGVAE